MDLYQIRYFLTIVEVGSFTKAAEQLFVSQPSLSVGIKKLEQELGEKLFERGGRRVLLTPAGRLFQTKAQSILTEYQSLRQSIERLKEEPVLRIATLHSIRSSHMAEIIGAFREQYPHVVIKICNGYLPEIKDWLEDGIVDLAITWLPEPDDNRQSQLMFHQLVTLAVPQSHPYASARSVCLADLNDQLYIERTNCEFWQVYPKIFEMAGVAPNVVYSSNNEEWAISLVQAGMGMSIMPVWKDLPLIAYVPMTDLSLSRTIGLRWRAQNTLEVVDWFREFVMDHDWQVAG